LYPADVSNVEGRFKIHGEQFRDAMKILVSALACNPHWGSESHFGWAAVQCLAQDHELWVLTTPRNRTDLEKAQAAGKIGENVHFVYAGQFNPWHPNRLRAHLQGWKEYVGFTKEILPVARELHQTIQFDVAHHLTLASWRVPCHLWKLGLPLVFGPVGGNEQFPSRFLPILSPMAAAFELARKLSNTVSSFSPGVRACIRQSAHVFAANAETESLLIRLRGTRIGISRMLAYSHPDTGRPGAAEIMQKSMDGPLRLFAGGSLDGRKGVAMALQALARAKNRGVKFNYRYGGKGPEFNRIQKLVAQLGLQENVQLGDSLRGKDYEAELKASHIYLLPSLRDSAGITLAEAMLAGCVPVVADCGGPGQLVSEECGYKVPVSNPASLIEEIAKILIHLDQDRDELRKKGPAAAKRIATKFSEQNYRNTVNAVYRFIQQGKGPRLATD
jgi:glycosyltransferase involved in cell wall biosynthesis